MSPLLALSSLIGLLSFACAQAGVLFVSFAIVYRRVRLGQTIEERSSDERRNGSASRGSEAVRRAVVAGLGASIRFQWSALCIVLCFAYYEYAPRHVRISETVELNEPRSGLYNGVICYVEKRVVRATSDDVNAMSSWQEMKIVVNCITGGEATLSVDVRNMKYSYVREDGKHIYGSKADGGWPIETIFDMCNASKNAAVEREAELVGRLIDRATLPGFSTSVLSSDYEACFGRISVGRPQVASVVSWAYWMPRLCTVVVLWAVGLVYIWRQVK